MTATCTTRRGWPLERVLFALSGTVTVQSTAFAAFSWALLLSLTAFVGVNQWLYLAAGAGPASLLLGRRFGLRPVPDS